MAIEDFPQAQNRFSGSSTPSEESNKDTAVEEVQISRLYHTNFDFDSSTTFPISSHTLRPSKINSECCSIPRRRDAPHLVTSQETLEVEESAKTKCRLVADTATSDDLQIVKQSDSIDNTNITSLRDLLRIASITHPIVIFPFTKTDEDSSLETCSTIFERDLPRSTTASLAFGTHYQRLIGPQNLHDRNSILYRIIFGSCGTPPHHEGPNMQSLFTPYYSEEERILKPGYSETELKSWNLGFNTRTFARSIRDFPHRTPTLVRYRMVGDHRTFLSYLTRKHTHEREKLAWNKISSTLNPDLCNAPLSPGFEKLATDFFGGKTVREDYDDTSEPSTRTTGSEKCKNHNITYNGSEISNEDKRKCLHDPVFTIFIQDLVMCNDLENAKINEAPWHGASVLDPLEEDIGLDDLDVKSLLNLLSGANEVQSGTEEGHSRSPSVSLAILNQEHGVSSRDSDTVVTQADTMAKEVALPHPNQSPQLNSQELKDAKDGDEWMDSKEGATTAREFRKGSSKRNKNRHNRRSKKSSQANFTVPGDDEEPQSQEDFSVNKHTNGNTPIGNGLSQPCSSLEMEPDGVLQKSDNLTPWYIPRRNDGEDGEWSIVQSKSSYKTGHRTNASTHGTIRNLVRVAQRGLPRQQGLTSHPKNTSQSSLPDVSTTSIRRQQAATSVLEATCDGNDGEDHTSVNDYTSKDLETACVTYDENNGDKYVSIDCEPYNIPLLSDSNNLTSKVDWEKILTGGTIPASSGAVNEEAVPIVQLSNLAESQSCNSFPANIQDPDQRGGLETQDGDQAGNVTYESILTFPPQRSEGAVLAVSENDSLSDYSVPPETVDIVGTDNVQIKVASTFAMLSAEMVSAQNLLAGNSTRTDLPNFICESSESDTDEHEEIVLAISNPDFGIIADCAFCGERMDPSAETPQVLCSGCGVSGEGRYCSVACLLVDAYDHSSRCMAYGASNQDPSCDLHIHSLYIESPITPSLGYHETPDRFRQRAFSMYCWSGVFPKLFIAWMKKYGVALTSPPNFDVTEEAKRTGDYAIFRSELTCLGPRSNPNGDVIFTIKLLADDPRKQILNRALNACFLVWNRQVTEFLYRLLNYIILHSESFLLFKYTEPLEVVYKEFKNQFGREFGFWESMAMISTEFNLWREWEVVGPVLLDLEYRNPILRQWIRC